MQADRRNILLLATCQALLLTNSSGLVTMNGVVGYALSPYKTLATLGASTYVLGSALATMPMSLWMAKVGRRRGFMTGALINVAGCGLAVTALVLQSFWLFCAATAVIGIYNAIGLQYRFAAAEVSKPEDIATATSMVLAGGIVGGFLGPALSRFGQNLFGVPFLGSFGLLALTALVALAVQSRVELPPTSHGQQSSGGRPLGEIVRQPSFLIAALAGASSYGLMSLLMTATPLAMGFCSHPYGAAVAVIQWHVLGMYGPAFFTGSLIKRWGEMPVVGAGVAILVLGSFVALHGTSVAHFLVALALVGVGWNFMYTGGTVLLAASHTPEEKARVQGANDFLVFSTMGVSAVTSGAMVSAAGWTAMNHVALAMMFAVTLITVWLSRRRAVPALST